MTSAFTLELRTKCTVVPTDASGNANDVASVLDTLCDHLEESGCVEFVVGGFGQQRWPVDVSTDLLLVLEQLPELTRALASAEKSFELDFYEQGICRRLDFSRTEDTLSVTCVSATDWQPSPAVIELSAADLVGMLAKLRKEFLDLAVARCPGLAASSGLREWREATRS